MVQLFRDRMRRDGGGYGWLSVWMHMITDLAGSAYNEHRRGVNMTPKMWIGSVLVALALIGVVGAGTLWAQSEDEIKIGIVSIWKDSPQTYRATADEGIPGVMRQAVEDGAIDQESADKIVRALSGEATEGTVVLVRDSKTFSATEESGIADAILQTVEEGVIDQATADRIIMRAFDALPSSGEVTGLVISAQEPKTFTATGEDGIAGAMLQAVEEGVIDQAAADRIMRAFDESKGSVLDGEGSAEERCHFSVSSAEVSGLASAIRQAVEDDEALSQIGAQLPTALTLRVCVDQ